MKLGVLVEDLSLRSPAQQLLDRFLVGYPHAGSFHRPRFASITVHGGAGTERDRRCADHGLRVAETADAALHGADAVLVCPRGAGHLTAEELVDRAIRAAPAGAAVFVHGLLARSAGRARAFAETAARRDVALMAGSHLATTWCLPPVDLPAGASVSEALIVVPGPLEEAPFLGVEALVT